MTVQYTPRITAKTYYEVRKNQTLIDGLNKYDITDGLANKTNWTTGIVAIDKSLFRVEVINSNGSVTSPEVVIINNFTYGFISTDMTNATVSVRYDGDLGVKDVITPSYNFDLTMNWSILLDNNSNPFPVTDQATFTQWLTNGFDSLGEVQNDFTNIVITDFIKVGNNIKCNLTATATTFALNNNIIVNFNKIGIINGLTILYLTANQLTSFNPTVPLPSSLQTLSLDGNQLSIFNPTIALPSNLKGLYLTANQLTSFNPTVPLPSNLIFLDLASNQFTLAGYTVSESWGNSLPISTGQSIQFSYNPASVSGTNLEAILISKGWTVLA